MISNEPGLSCKVGERLSLVYIFFAGRPRGPIDDYGHDNPARIRTQTLGIRSTFRLPNFQQPIDKTSCTASSTVDWMPMDTRQVGVSAADLPGSRRHIQWSIRLSP
jgi:hypothetical protein